jgi:nucleotide-binding universal stress UspA family protein
LGVVPPKEDMAVSFLERLLSQGGLPKVVDGRHPETNGTHGNGNTPKPDLLALPNEEEQQRTRCRRNVLVGLTGTDLDRELVTFACTIGKSKKVSVYVVYGIEVPRTLAVDAEMPEQTRQAGEALDIAAMVAGQLDVRIESEIIQSRHFGKSLVEEGEAHECALIIMGLPYALAHGGHFDLSETVDFVLKSAPCKVWLMRGAQPEKAEKPEKPEKVDQAERQKALAQ